MMKKVRTVNERGYMIEIRPYDPQRDVLLQQRGVARIQLGGGFYYQVWQEYVMSWRINS
jgi:hypothetical protein